MKAAQTTKNLAQHIAKQIAQEPLEVLKTAKEQVNGPENPQLNVEQPKPREQKKPDENKLQADKLRSERQVEALNREIADIQKQDLFKSLQKRISGGEEIPIEDYPELSLEQKQVLIAQMQAVKKQKEAAQPEQLAEPAAKKGRQLFNFGKKTAMKREQTHVEKPVPPSG